MNFQSNLPKLDTRSDQQKCDDLLSQYLAECEIEDKKATVDKDIRQRLDKLKDTTARGPPAEMENLSDKEMVMRVIQEVKII